MTLSQEHDTFLTELKVQKIDISIFLINGIQLTGRVTQFDDISIVIEGIKQQMVYRHAIATIVPKKH